MTAPPIPRGGTVNGSRWAVLAPLLLVIVGLLTAGVFTVATQPHAATYSVPASAGPSTGHDWNDEQTTNALYGAALTQCNGPSVTATVNGGVYVATVRCPS